MALFWGLRQAGIGQYPHSSETWAGGREGQRHRHSPAQGDDMPFVKYTVFWVCLAQISPNTAQGNCFVAEACQGIHKTRTTGVSEIRDFFLIH